MEHKVELTQSEPIKCKMYPTPYKMQAVVDQEIDNMLAMGVCAARVVLWLDHSDAMCSRQQNLKTTKDLEK